MKLAQGRRNEGIIGIGDLDHGASTAGRRTTSASDISARTEAPSNDNKT
jgi:hypothetical protein